MAIWQRQGQKLLIFWKNQTNASVNRKIFSAAIAVGLFTALVKVVAIIKEVVVAWRFGTGNELDAFLIALTIPSFIINLVGGSLSSALIPVYIKVLEQKGLKAAQRLFSGVTICSLGFLSIAVIFILSTAPMYLPWMASGFNSEKLNLTFYFLCALSPFILLSSLVIIWSSILNAREHFALAAFSPIVTPAISIALLLWFKSWGIFALVAGLFLGTVLEIVALGIGLRHQGISLFPKWHGFDNDLRQVFSQYIPMMAGAFLLSSAIIVDQAMAAMLSPGSVAVLNYSNRAIASPMSLITTALGSAVVPYFSKMIAVEDWTGLRQTFKKYLWLIFITTAPLAGMFIIFSQPIVQLLFQRGSFRLEDTYIVAETQSFFALQIPFYIANLLLIKLVISMQMSNILKWVSGFALILNIILNYFFMQWFGIKGIALSTSCVYLFSFLYLLVFANKQITQKINN
ncbi:virulence factor MviN [Calothrix sp. HK-06]|nr:virulence factor MviN [Calothrix sp. HK-06]